MANIVADPDSSCHGVLHRVTQKEFIVLQEIESNYSTVQVPVTPYKPHSSSSSSSNGHHTHPPVTATAEAATAPGAGQPAACRDSHTACIDGNASGKPAAAASDAPPPNTQGNSSPTTQDPSPTGPSDCPVVIEGHPITATAFIVQPSAIAVMMEEHPEWTNSLPSDRYIRIISAGLKHYGSDPAWVEWLAAQPCKHGREPGQYFKLPLPDSQQHQDGSAQADLPTFTMQQLQEHLGVMPDNKAVFALGPKVVEVDVPSKPKAAFVSIIEKHFAGRQVAFHMCMMLHEPRLPPISCPGDVCREHIEWAEDAVVEFLAGHHFPARQIGWLLEDGATGGNGASSDAAAVKDAAEALHEEDEATAAPETGVY